MMKVKRPITRRSFLAGATAGVVLAGCGGSEGGAAGASSSSGAPGGVPRPKGRVVILGFDGAEPSIIQAMIDRGELPNFAKLAQGGSFLPLRSTIPPQSPVAWTSFTTCKNPGGHNIFDFIRRDPASRTGPIPKVGTGELLHPKFGDDGSLSSAPEAVSYRMGDSFWKVADAQGLRCKVFNVPFAFPGDAMEHGIQLCGLGVPDLRGTTSTSFALSESFSESDLASRLSGGARLKLKFDGSGTAKVSVPGPRNTRYKFRDPRAYTASEVTIRVDRGSGAGSVEVDGNRIEIRQGAWSEFIGMPFRMTEQYTAYGMTRFYPIEIGDQVRLYMTCVQIRPDKPYVPITEPASYSEELHGRYGLFRTIGWHYDTHALRQDRLDEHAFLADIKEGMAFREKLTLDELDRGDFDLLISAWTATDRVGHMFWRFRDPGHPLYDPEKAKIFGKALEESYVISDRITGRVMEKLGPDDLLMVLSDHGFESWRRGFDVNAWLESTGFLAVKDRAKAEGGFLQGIDWANTKAYSVGLSSLYLNVSGRERFGTVGPGQADAVIAELKDKLIDVKDDATGLRVFSSIYTRHDLSGEAMANAPDISFGYDNKYQSSKNAAKGAVGRKWFGLNKDKWSGEHAASDVARLPGIFFCNQKIEATDPSILDLGVMSLGYLGADVPADFEGRDLLG